MANRSWWCAFALVAVAACPVARAERHSVFSLVDNRPLAHLQRRGGLYLAAGGAGMAKYVRFGKVLAGWKIRASEEGRRVAIAQAQAVLEVPLTAAQAREGVIHLGLKSPVASSVRATARGKSSERATPLKPGWQIVSVALPSGALAAGENAVTLGFANKGMAVEWIQIGGTAPTGAEPSGAGVTLPKGGGAAWYAFVPSDGAIVARGDAGGCKISLRVGDRGESELKLDGSAVDLAPPGGRFARVELAADGPGCTAATLQSADLVVAGAAPQPPAKSPPKNVIVWLTDDTRSDKFKLYNPKTRVETPVFDGLARRGTLFASAYTQGNESRVSHASIWTSMYPSVHQMLSEKAKLKPEFVTLAEAVRPSGRATLGVMGNGFIDQFWGFGDGWDHLENHIHDGGGLKADDIVASGLKAIDGAKSKPFFLYLGTIDAHVSWRAHEPWIKKYDPEPYSGPFVKACLDPQLDQIVAGKLHPTERDKTRIVALYDSDVSYNDHAFGALLDALKRRNLDGETMILFTSDHGEELWDRTRIGHGQSLHEELVHVPFLAYYPPYFPAGKIVEEGIDVLDLLPTITDALGVKTPDGVQGESIIPLANGVGAGYPRPSIASQYELAHTMRLARWKLWVGGAGNVQLYDLAADPKEEHDLAATRPVERRALTDAMGTWMAFRNQWKKRAWGVASNLSPGFARDVER